MKDAFALTKWSTVCRQKLLISASELKPRVKSRQDILGWVGSSKLISNNNIGGVFAESSLVTDLLPFIKVRERREANRTTKRPFNKLFVDLLFELQHNFGLASSQNHHVMTFRLTCHGCTLNLKQWKSLRFSENSLSLSQYSTTEKISYYIIDIILLTVIYLYWLKLSEFLLNLRDSHWFKFRACTREVSLNRNVRYPN